MIDPLSPELMLAPKNGLALLSSACVGGLIGLVRQWNAREHPVAGVRTFALWSTFGFVATQLERAGFPWLFLAGLAAVCSLIAAYSFRNDKAGAFGLTTMTAGALTYLSGALLACGLTRYAIGLAIIVAVLIGMRNLTDAWSGRLTETDVRAGLQFAFLSGIILPLVPDEKLSGVFNPYDTWRMVILVAGVNLAGYAAMRFLGERAGAAASGIVGGLASSTAVTLAFSRRSKEQPAHGYAYAQAVLLACSIMVPRVLFIIFALNPALAAAVTPPALAVMAATLATPAWIWFRKQETAVGEVPPVKNPLNLGQSVKFALLYALIVFLLDSTRHLAGGTGLYALSFLSGLTDMDAIGLSLAGRTDDGDLAATTAATAIIIAMGANTLVKLGLGLLLGDGHFRKLMAIGLGLPLITIVAITGYALI